MAVVNAAAVKVLAVRVRIIREFLPNSGRASGHLEGGCPGAATLTSSLHFDCHMSTTNWNSRPAIHERGNNYFHTPCQQ